MIHESISTSAENTEQATKPAKHVCKQAGKQASEQESNLYRIKKPCNNTVVRTSSRGFCLATTLTGHLSTPDLHPAHLQAPEHYHEQAPALTPALNRSPTPSLKTRAMNPFISHPANLHHIPLNSHPTPPSSPQHIPWLLQQYSTTTTDRCSDQFMHQVAATTSHDHTDHRHTHHRQASTTIVTVR